ncbi:hypothetical protein [Sinorhizobium medicae]|uniref:Cap15 family cyclic dinucleotide receptor domain-containing protein n=1 Tax=Sinorhizobium medicae TaxID=110321 RepID=UPI00037B4AAA|nr:hypothetical protein [Sinorhizobium medicae]RVJ16180.1 hypothetical protein CN179_33125 [Sinorhizobium medicae]UFX03340.1 hypothetical protein SmedWSM1115_06720 [Sinorhizobium medicae WSM1115]
MWSLLQRKTQLLIIVSASILSAWGLEAVWFWCLGEQTTPLKWISFAVSIVGVVMVGAADLFWFRLARIVPYMQTKMFPDLNGDWDGHLKSTWMDPETGTTLPLIRANLKIRQTFFTTSVTWKMGESFSKSTRVFLEPDYENRRYRLWYSYNNDPQAQFSHRSSPHEGVAYLDLDWDTDRNRLTGTYYTARKTTGDMDVRRQP